MKLRVASAPTLALFVVAACSSSNNNASNSGADGIGGHTAGAGASSITGGARSSGGTKSGESTQGSLGGAVAVGGSKAATGGAGVAGSSIGFGGSTSGGAAATGGATSAGGVHNSGGVAALGGAVSTGGVRNTGGSVATGGAASTGGVRNTGGAVATGSAASTGGVRNTGGSVATGGAPSTGGTRSTGGVSTTGGTPSTGGISSTGGSTGSSTSVTSANIIYLHHSTGGVIWGGGVPEWFANYNSSKGTNYAITELAFPKDAPYGWENYPYDYWNIWVNHAGSAPYMEEPTLEILTQQYTVIVWKHCFPVSGIGADTGSPDIGSSTKSLENYKLQYNALKTKMHQFPTTQFIVWTGSALRQEETDAESATRAQAFSSWVKSTWDEAGDNIFVWDFRDLETGGGLYLLPANASGDSHPNDTFAAKVAPYFGQRVVDVIQGRGDSGSLTGN